MDNWKVRCQSCGRDFVVEAHSEAEAISKAEAVHEEAQAEATQFRCDVGPMMNNAFNLSHPERPGDPRDW